MPTTKGPAPADSGSMLVPQLYLLITMAFFGSAFASSKAVVAEVPHGVAAALRFGGGAILLGIVALVLRSRATALSTRAILRCGAAGLLGVFAYNVFFFWGLSYAPSIDGTVIVPVLSPILATFTLIATKRESVSRVRLVGLLVGVVGAIIFFVGAGAVAPSGSGRLLGDLIFFLGAVCWAAYSITSKRVLTGVDPLSATAVGTGVGGLCLILVALPSVGAVEWGSLSASTWANVMYLVVGPTAIAYLFYFRGLRSVAPSTATIMMFFVPVFGVACSVLFLGETFGLLQTIGAPVMVVGAVLAVTQRAFPSPPVRADRGSRPIRVS
jgi:drug/metabolite transporter (DMT)-like permease